MEKKKHKAYHLIGQVVMVDPAFASKDGSGKPGFVFSINPKNGLAQVGFNPGNKAEIDIEKLITLNLKAVIMQRLINNWEINPNDFKVALKTCRLITEKKFAEALELAVTNAVVKSICTASCNEWLEIKNRKNKHLGYRR